MKSDNLNWGTWLNGGNLSRACANSSAVLSSKEPCTAPVPAGPGAPKPSGTAPAEGRSSGSGHRLDPVAYSNPSCLNLMAGMDSALSGYALACINLARVPKSQDTYQRWEQKMSICANCEQVSGHLSIARIIQQCLVIWCFKSDLLAPIRIETFK